MNDDDFRVFCGMMDGLAFLPVPDLTNGIHLLRTLCSDDQPEAVELLDYFDSHSMTRHIDGWACPTRLKKLLFQPSHMLLVLASPLTVASCTFQMAVGNIGGLCVKTETSLLARRPLPSTCVELGGTSDSITNISA
jgi:hypothetical protein